MTDTNTDPQPPDVDDAAGNDAGNGAATDNGNAAALAELRQKYDALEKRLAERPPSSVEQMRDQLAEVLGIQKTAIDERNIGKEIVAQSSAQVEALSKQLRDSTLRDLARQHSFRNPADLVDFANARGLTAEDDLTAFASSLAEERPYMVERRTDEDMSQGGPSVGSGADALARMIARETGRG